MITIDDFVMLGKTVPEPTRSDGRVFVCSAGISVQLGHLVRVYPLAQREAPERWSVSTVSLERNPADSRHESWKIAGDRSPGAHERINRSFVTAGKIPGSKRAGLLARHAVPSIAEANARRISLAVVHPSSMELDFEFNPSSPDSPQLALFDDGAEKPKAGAKRFAYIPRLWFTDEGGTHHLMLRDWGCFEFMRKYGDGRRRELTAALRLDKSCSLLVGNLSNQRNAWLVISVLRGLRAEQALFDIGEIEGNAA